MRNPKNKVLVIDDDESFLREIHGLLMEGSYEVVTCSDPHQALLFIHDFIPDSVILDLAMPALDGHALLYLIRQKYPRLPVFICTGMPNIDACSLRRAGASEVFQKPFSPRDIFGALGHAA